MALIKNQRDRFGLSLYQGYVGNYFVEGYEVSLDLALKMKVRVPREGSRLCHIYIPADTAVQWHT